MAERLLLLTLFFLASCRNAPAMHEWYPSECAPVTAPVEIVSGRFITRDQVSVRIPSGSVVNNGWGAIGSTFITDPILKALPERLQLRWFSYAENRFYGGDFTLDGERLDSLFNAGYDSPVSGEHKAYDRIVAGMSPGGGVALWLKGEQITKELAFFHAAVIDEDWNAFSNGSPRPRTEYVEAQLAQVLDHEQLIAARSEAGAGLARWDTAYRREYEWSARMLGRGRVRQLLLHYWNGELLDAGSGAPASQPLPQQADLYWNNPDGVSYGATIGFAFNEVSAAFARLAPGGTLRLNLETDTLAADVAVFLENGTEVYRFRQAQVRVFRM